MKKQFYLSKSRNLLLFLFALIVGTGSAWADTLTETFDDVTVTSRYLLSNGWLMNHNNGNYQGFGGSYDYQIKSGNYDGETGNSLSCDYSDNNEYVVIPTKLCGTFSYYVKRSSSSNGTVTFFEATREGDVFTVTNTQLATTSTSSTWSSKSFDLGSNGKYVAIRLLKSRIDQISATIYEEASGPGFAVKDGSTTLSSPYAYSFGLATAGTEKEFTLSNPGTEATPIAIDVTGANGFTAAVEGNATSIPAGGQKTLTITMPDATASGSIVVTPTGAGLSAFTFNVSGTVRDPNKVYETLSSKPDGWNTTDTWSYNASGATTTAWYLSNNVRLYTPKLTVSEGEKFIFEVKGNYDGYHAVQLEYSTDATTWTASETSVTVTSDWQTVEISDIPAGNYYIALHAAYSTIRNFYGGELPKVAKMVVTQPATLDFGLFDKDATPAPTKTFTIANTGTATLNGISVSSGNAAFTITNAPTSLAAGASQTVTITMATGTTGALSSLITVSATDMQDVKFTVTGCIKPTGMPVEDFASGLPSNWTNASWTFANGVATGTSNSAYLYTPKLKFSEGDFIIIKCKNSDNMSGDHLYITGSNDNGASYSNSVYYKDIALPSSNAEWSTYIITDIPTTVNKLRFTGYYVIVDEIHGLTYTPVLSVTTGSPAAAVNTPANYDFGECAANASVTYNFANAGAGVINITGVEITGDGKDSYSTNWTESVAAPFDLVINRTYDSSRAGAGAQEAAVTVTTSEGSFVINVTGTDKGANDPEFAVFIGEAEQTTGADLGFGTITSNTVKTFKIQNAGTGALNIIAVTMPDADYTTDLESAPSQESPLVIAAGATKTINVTLAASAKAIKSDKNIVISAEDFEDFTFVADATVMPGATLIDFNDNALPEGWTNNASYKWSFADGKAYCTANSSSPAELVTKKLQFAADDFITISATSYDDYDNNFIEILGSTDNGDTWTAFDAKKYISRSQIPYGSYATLVVDKIPATVNKLKFRGYYVRIDEIAGLVYDNNDPVIAVYSNAEATQAVATATTKDFGWAQSAQSATYYIKNGGTGTLTISDIDVPAGFTAATAGDVMTVAAGADPLALTVTMSAGEIGEKSGTVTLTTDGGNFTIPVKGFIYGDRNLVDFTNSSQYTGWTTDGWTISEGVATPTSTYSAATMQTTKFNVAVNEKLYVDIKGSTSNVEKSFAYAYSTDNGVNWTDVTQTISAGQYVDVADQVLVLEDIAGDAERTVLIQFISKNLGINHIYGFEAVPTPVMALDKTADKNFGMQTANADYVITVTNNGTGTLNNLAASLETGTNYSVVITKPDGESTTTISEGRATVPAGQQAIITVTQLFDAANGLASFSDVLTISADDVASEEINLSGKTRDGSKWYVDFASTIPVAFIEKGNWSVYSQQARVYTESSLISQTLTIAANEKLQFDAKTMGTTTLKVRHSLNGGLSWSDYTDFSSADGLNSSTYTTLQYGFGNTDASVVAMVEFLGANVYVDNIYGGALNNESPMIQIKKSNTVVASGVAEAFGSILAESTANYTIKNIGNGSLTIKEPIAVTGGASAAVNVTSLGAGESATLTITMPVEAPYGEKSGAVTVKTNLGDFVINYTATTMNPDALNFSDGTFPTGWYNGGWSSYSGYIYKNNSGTADFISQKLNVAGTDDVLKFDAENYGSQYASNSVLEVSYSTDRVNWTLIDDYASQLTTSFKTFSIRGLAAGKYYLKFTGRYVDVDNIIGWTKVADIEHDLYVTTTNVPKTLAADYTATATVTSLRAAEEGVYAKLFFGNDVIATSETANVTLNGSTTFTMTATEAPTTGLYKAKVVVYYSDGTVAFTTGTTNVGTLVLNETDEFTAEAGSYGAVTLNRSFVAGWNTVCLPFDFALSKLGEGAKALEFTAYDADSKELTFSPITIKLTAGKPYVVYVENAITEPFALTDVTIGTTAGNASFNGVSFVGTYAPMAAGTLENKYGLTAAGKIAKASDKAKMKGFRAYFNGVPAGARVVFVGDDDTTSISEELRVNSEEFATAVYNLQGQKVENLKKGQLYIVNGKKTVIK